MESGISQAIQNKRKIWTENGKTKKDRLIFKIKNQIRESEIISVKERNSTSF